MNKKLLIGLSALVVIAAAVAIIGSRSGNNGMNMSDMSSTTTSSASSSDATATNAVTIKSYMFMPSTITVKAGTTVTWTNQDAVEHNIVADTASADAPNGPLFGQGKTYSFTFKKAGTYAYHCAPHPYMKATVIVTN